MPQYRFAALSTNWIGGNVLISLSSKSYKMYTVNLVNISRSLGEEDLYLKCVPHVQQGCLFVCFLSFFGSSILWTCSINHAFFVSQDSELETFVKYLRSSSSDDDDRAKETTDPGRDVYDELTIDRMEFTAKVVSSINQLFCRICLECQRTVYSFVTPFPCNDCSNFGEPTLECTRLFHFMTLYSVNVDIVLLKGGFFGADANTSFCSRTREWRKWDKRDWPLCHWRWISYTAWTKYRR